MIGVPVITYYPRKTRTPSPRELQNRELVREIHRESYSTFAPPPQRRS
jgi:hypothetical protein